MRVEDMFRVLPRTGDEVVVLAPSRWHPIRRHHWKQRVLPALLSGGWRPVSERPESSLARMMWKVRVVIPGEENG